MCDELAAQVTELQNQLARVEAEIDDPETTCQNAGLDPGSDACILYIKDLTREVGGFQASISSLQQQQQNQGCLS